MRIITLTYDPKSNLLTADSEGAGTSIDDCDVTFKLTPPEGLDLTGAVLELLYGVTIYNGGRRYPAKGRFNSDYETILSRQTLSACTGGTLPIRLHIVWPNRVVRTSRQTILQVDYIDDPDGDYIAAYGDMLMLRTDSWDWVREWTYQSGSFAVYDGSLWQSSKDDNVGNVPSDDSEWWSSVAVDGLSPTVEWDDDVLVVTDAEGPHRSPPLTGPQGEKGDKGDTGEPGVSPTFTWQGTTLVVTDVNGEWSQDLKGEKGDTGATGPQGVKGDTGDTGPQGPQGIQGVQGPQGDPFSVSKVYSSVEEMNAGYATDGVPIGGFVVITTGDVEDEDNAKIYCKGDTAYEYITDMSGAQGIQGPQGPQGEQGPMGPQGPKGDTGDAGEMDAALDAESTNGVQNAVITQNINRIDDALADKAEASALNSHVGNTSNPHAVTKAQVGLDKVDNTSDMEKPVSTAMQAALNLKADESDLAGYVPTTRKVNSKALGTDITLSAADVGALPVGTHIPNDVTVDDALSDTSENPVQNKIIKAALDGKQDDFTVVSVNLPASGWSSNQQTVAVSGVTASTEIVVVSYSPGSYQAYTEAGVRATAQGAGSLTFACDEAPSADLVAEVMYA